ncbi:MAG: hypothetical protein QXN55_09070 [Candidatus Nitrosotenuis sp.]
MLVEVWLVAIAVFVLPVVFVGVLVVLVAVLVVLVAVVVWGFVAMGEELLTTGIPKELVFACDVN